MDTTNFNVSHKRSEEGKELTTSRVEDDRIESLALDETLKKQSSYSYLKNPLRPLSRSGKITQTKTHNVYRQRTFSYVQKLKNTVNKQKSIIRYLKFKLKKLEHASKASCAQHRMENSSSFGQMSSNEFARNMPFSGKISKTSEVHFTQNKYKDGKIANDIENMKVQTRPDRFTFSDEVTFNENNLEVQISENDVMDISSDTIDSKNENREEVDEEVKKCVEDFMCREDVSVTDINMKYLRSCGKVTRFRRHFLSVLYKQFRAEVNSTCTYSQFCKYIPESVVKPDPTFWKIILCSRCENAELKFVEVVAKILLREDILLEEVLVKQDLFDHVCQELGKLKNSNDPFTYMTWAKTLLGKMEANENIVTTTVGSACTDLLKELDLLKEHMNRCYNQYEAVREAREETEISPIHAVVHIDWYESPATFVARHLHTSYYYGDGFKTLHAGFVRTKEKSRGFASLSDCRNHTAPAVWASINNILVNLAKEGMKVITIVSDSATAQYRNKGNFYLMRRFAKQNNVEMKWIYLEGGHGKGIADSIGAKIKDIICDTIVRYKEKSFRNTMDILPVIKDLTPIELLSHSENLVQQYKNLLARQHLQVIPSTYKIHEVCVKETSFYVKESSADKLPFYSLDTQVKGNSV